MIVQYLGKSIEIPIGTTTIYSHIPPKTILEAPPDCDSIGPVLYGESGPCAFRLRKCDEFGTCTLLPCSKTEHSCAVGTGKQCSKYEPR